MRKTAWKWIVRGALLVFWLVCVILILSQGCSRPEEWQTWPRRGSVPVATSDCQTDICLETRETILRQKLGVER